MKANELMIGDWISVMEIPAQVFELSYDKEEKEMTIGILDPQGEVYSCYYGYDHVEPIPLTAEILERNGFNCEEIIQPHWISEDGRILLRNDESLINSNNKWSVHVDNEDMQTIGYFELTYVHQLQHALRLCNIDKEIEI